MALRHQSNALPALLGSTSRARILTHLFGRSSEDEGIREMAALAGVDYKSARRELLLLEELGIVSSKSLGRRRVFRLDPGFPALAELRRLVQKIGEGGVLRTLLKELETLPDLRIAVLYGSFARGEQDEGSDLDLLLVGEEEEDEILPVIERLERLLGREVQYLHYTPEEFQELRGRGNPFLERILEGENVILRGGAYLGS